MAGPRRKRNPVSTRAGAFSVKIEQLYRGAASHVWAVSDSADQEVFRDLAPTKKAAKERFDAWLAKRMNDQQDDGNE